MLLLTDKDRRWVICQGKTTVLYEFIYVSVHCIWKIRSSRVIDHLWLLKYFLHSLQQRTPSLFVCFWFGFFSLKCHFFIFINLDISYLHFDCYSLSRFPGQDRGLLETLREWLSVPTFLTLCPLPTVDLCVDTEWSFSVEGWVMIYSQVVEIHH